MATRTARSHSRKSISTDHAVLQQELTDVLVATVTNVVSGRRRIMELAEALTAQEVLESFNAARKRIGPMPLGSDAYLAFDALQKSVRRWLARRGFALSFDREHEVYILRKAPAPVSRESARQRPSASKGEGEQGVLVPASSASGSVLRPSSPTALSLAELIDVILALPPEDQDVIVHVIENQRAMRSAVSENGGKGSSSSRRAH